MPTLKQKRLARLAVEHAKNPTMTKGKLVEMGGYSKAVQTEPAKALESKGFLEELDKLGLTDDLLTSALVEDIKGKKGKRARELELGYKVRGRLKEQPYGNTYNTVIVTDEQRARIARRAIARLSGSEGTLDRLSDSDEPKV